MPRIFEPKNDEAIKVVQDLIDVGSGKITHSYNGLCPDDVEGFDTRDDECPACRILIAAQRLIAN